MGKKLDDTVHSILIGRDDARHQIAVNIFGEQRDKTPDFNLFLPYFDKE
jgi:hypothetical protein